MRTLIAAGFILGLMFLQGCGKPGGSNSAPGPAPTSSKENEPSEASVQELSARLQNCYLKWTESSHFQLLKDVDGGLAFSFATIATRELASLSRNDQFEVYGQFRNLNSLNKEAFSNLSKKLLKRNER